MVKQIIKEAIEKNPIGLKEAVEAELMSRVQLALEAKKTSIEEASSSNRIIKDLGQGIKISIDPDNSMVIGDKTAPGGSQIVVLETDHVEKMVSVLARNVLTRNKPVKITLGRGVKMSIDSDGDVTISDSNTPIGRQMVVLTSKQAQEILKVVK